MSGDEHPQADISKSKFHGPDGSFQRAPSSFRNFLKPEEVTSGRYHLYVSYACPWATRALIVRALKGLDAHVGLTVVSPRMGAHGWPLGDADPFPGATADPHEGAQHIKDLYLTAAPDYEGRFTVPVLWDTHARTIVNNESSEIIRIFNSAFNDILPPEKAAVDLYPEELRAEIDAVNEWVYSDVNNGVYRSGFAATQEAYEAAVTKLFAALDRLEGMLAGGKKYLVGGRLTEADVRLFVTLIRFDPVYVGHFKCNIRTIRDGYPELNRWMKNLYWTEDAFKSTTNFDHIKTHYYWSHPHTDSGRMQAHGWRAYASADGRRRRTARLLPAQTGAGRVRAQTDGAPLPARTPALSQTQGDVPGGVHRRCASARASARLRAQTGERVHPAPAEGGCTRA